MFQYSVFQGWMASRLVEVQFRYSGACVSTLGSSGWKRPWSADSSNVQWYWTLNMFQSWKSEYMATAAASSWVSVV